MSAVPIGFLFAACAAYGISVLFFSVLRRTSAHRILVFVLLAVPIALTPWLIPTEARIARFVASVYSVVLVAKMWDLHLGAARSIHPRWAEFLVFMANVPSLVHRRTGSERQPTPRQNTADLIRALVQASLSGLALFFLHRMDWSATWFLVEHVLKATPFFIGITAVLRAGAVLARALGAYAPDPVRRSLLARTPADFWRNYNRWLGEFLREDVFRLIGGRRHPIRATLAVFALSGLLHEYIFFVALGRVQGFQLTFFLVQGVAVVMTQRAKPPRIVGIGSTFGFNAVTSVLFFASFQSAVPFYEGGLPAWLWGA